MEDLPLKEFAKNLLIWLVVFVVFGSLFVIILVNKFGSRDITINQKIDKKDSLIVLVVSNDTKNKRDIESVLKENNISYEVVNRDKERYFEDFLQKLNLEEQDIIPPTILYIEKQEVNAMLIEVKELDELNSFIEYNNLSGKGR